MTSKAHGDPRTELIPLSTQPERRRITVKYYEMRVLHAALLASTLYLTVSGEKPNLDTYPRNKLHDCWSDDISQIDSYSDIITNTCGVKDLFKTEDPLMCVKPGCIDLLVKYLRDVPDCFIGPINIQGTIRGRIEMCKNEMKKGNLPIETTQNGAPKCLYGQIQEVEALLHSKDLAHQCGNITIDSLDSTVCSNPSCMAYVKGAIVNKLPNCTVDDRNVKTVTTMLIAVCPEYLGLKRFQHCHQHQVPRTATGTSASIDVGISSAQGNSGQIATNIRATVFTFRSSMVQSGSFSTTASFVYAIQAGFEHTVESNELMEILPHSLAY